MEEVSGEKIIEKESRWVFKKIPLLDKNEIVIPKDAIWVKRIENDITWFEPWKEEKTKIKINELTPLGMYTLERLMRKLKELKKDKNSSLVDIMTKQIEISKLITDMNSEYTTKKQREYEIKKMKTINMAFEDKKKEKQTYVAVHDMDISYDELLSIMGRAS